MTYIHVCTFTIVRDNKLIVHLLVEFAIDVPGLSAGVISKFSKAASITLSHCIGVCVELGSSEWRMHLWRPRHGHRQQQEWLGLWYFPSLTALRLWLDSP